MSDKPLRWSKTNLVTRTDGADRFQCKECKFVKIYYGMIRDRDCPRCVKKEKKAETHRLKLHGKPFGWWGVDMHPCGQCKSESELVPKKGHPLSKYWRLEQDDGVKLYYCTGGCLEE